MADRIVVTGTGATCALGASLGEIWHALLAGKTAIKDWDDLKDEDFRHSSACRIERYRTVASPGCEMAKAAALEAVQSADIKLTRDTGVYIGSTMGESRRFEEAARTGDRSQLADATGRLFAKTLAAQFGLSGPQIVYGTACAAGNYAIAAGADALRRGEIDAALVGGVEPFSRIAMTGFSRSRAMSATGRCLPFDESRDGMVLGEGAAILVLEREADARLRGATPLAVVGLMGATCDAHHATAPHPSGVQSARAITQALRLEDIAAVDIDAICAHGTGTLLSDAAEAKAIGSVFGHRTPTVMGLKAAIGHSLGAASAIEAALCVKAISTATVPPTAGTRRPAFSIRLATRPIEKPIRWIANLAFAFGGLNTALLLGAP